MDRRDFLKLTGLSTVLVVTNFNSLNRLLNIPVELSANGRIFRGTQDGKIYVSENAGKTWTLHTNFGDTLSVESLFADSQGRIHSIFRLDYHTFELILAQNNRTWLTAQSPAILRS